MSTYVWIIVAIVIIIAWEVHNYRIGGVVSINEIIPGRLYIGNQAASNDPETLRRCGIRTVISIENRAKTPAERAQYRDMGIQQYGAVLVDEPDAPIWLFFEWAADHARDSTGPVLIHCYAGMSRSATLTAYVLMRDYGMRMPEALAYIRERRPQIHPNEGFLRQLDEADQKMKARI
jgi:dual specificity phosphatase 12